MYPSRFNYEAPRTLDEAIELLHRGGGEAKVLAGGQSLVPLLKLRFASPEDRGQVESQRSSAGSRIAVVRRQLLAASTTEFFPLRRLSRCVEWG